MIRPDTHFAALRARFSPVAAASHVPIDSTLFDSALSGGIARAGLHEVFGDGEENIGAAAAFVLALVMRADVRPVIWVREDRAARQSGRLHGPGLAELGFDPAELYLVAAPDGLSTLRAGADIARCGAGGVAAGLLGGWRDVDRRRFLATARGDGQCDSRDGALHPRP